MYNHGEIDKKWQDRWLKSGAFKAEDFSNKPKKYLLVEFPFPSGAGLHVGHPRSYVALDVMARKYRQEGNNVLYPMGWDAFGLPTENYAIKTGRPPAEVTAENIATFKAQIQSLGLSFDWDREVNSTDPGYYKWTQWQFLQFFKAGLAYKAKTMINWCPKDKIGLANEEAAGGVCDRCGGPVEKREKEQWMIGITKYADRLLSDLNTVDYLPRIRKQQEEWIGRSEGAEVDFAIEGSDEKIRVFTTRPDTLFGVTYITLAPEHDLVKELVIAHDQVIGEPLADSMTRQAVRAMCVRDGKLLMIYGKDIKEYLLPGGGIEEGETPEDAVMREFTEETGYKNVKIIKKLGTFKHNYYHTRLDKKICGTETIFIVDIENDEQVPRTEEETAKTEYVWMTIPEAKEKIVGVPGIFGKCVIQIEHLERYRAVEEYIANVSRKTEMERTDATREKTGVFTGRHAINPVNGERIEIWISDYVLAGYGTGAVMAVPAHDERDFEFAKKFGLPIKQVVAPYVLNVQWMPREDRETHTRPVTSVIIRHKKTGEYLLQKMADGRCGFTGGGIEVGETAEQAMIREVAEETGFTDVKIEKVVGEFWGHGFKPKRDYNCYDPDTVFVVEVDGEPSQERSAEDLMAHEIVWKKADEVRAFINLTQHQIVWDWYQKGETYFAEEGVATTTSEFLSGLKTQEAKQKMIEWLEEHHVGARKITYKLRDWVFSRQRYWGEPIPLVHCEHCAEEKLQYVFIHGFKGSVEGDFFPWLKKEVEAKEHSVIALDLPNPTKPNVDEQVKFLLENVKFTKNTVIVAHSLGTVVAQKLLPQISERVRKTILVDGFMEPKFVDKDRPYVAEATSGNFDASAINAKTEELILLADETQTIISLEQHRSMAQFYRAPLQVVHPNGGHFSSEREPSVLELATITGWNSLPDSELPLTLPHVDKYEPTDNGESPLASIPEFVNTKCPRCGGAAKRETDTMPNWAGSSWYFLRYIDAHNDKEFAAADKLKYWMPVDLYNGGMEHTTLHLLYSRFWNKFMYDLGYVPTAEPYARRVSHGLIMAEDGTKMSKSKGNVVNPDEIVQAQGADTLRMYELFIGPFSEPAPWSTNGVSGVRRFLDRVMRLSGLVMDTEPENVTRGLHKAIKKVTEDVERMSFNTAVAEFMTFVNTVYGSAAITKETLKTFLTLLSSFAPHVSEELWSQLGGVGLVCQQQWPRYNAALTVDEFFELVVQVNGKVRDKIQVAGGTEEDTLKKLALASEKVQQWLEGKEPQKIVVVKNKIVSIVV